MIGKKNFYAIILSFRTASINLEKIIKLNNVISTPHNAAYDEVTLNKMFDNSFLYLKNYFKNTDTEVIYDDGNNLEQTRRDVFSPGNEISKMLGCTRHASEIIGEFLFVHAGIIKKFVNKNKINLTNILSRPVKKNKWQYSFFLEFSGHASDNNVLKLFKELQKRRYQNVYFRVYSLSNYKTCFM